MDPFTLITLGTTAAGFAMNLFGGSEKASAAKEGNELAQQGSLLQEQAAGQRAAASKEIARQELNQETLRRKMMELDANRRSIEAVRQGQRARALGLAAGVAQGADAGSGVAAGIANATSQTGFNLLGIGNALEAGRINFGYTAAINQQKMNIADTETLSARGAGLISRGQGISNVGAAEGGAMQDIGKSLVGSASIFGKAGGTLYNNYTKTGSLFG
jgi:hypothetical protein